MISKIALQAYYKGIDMRMPGGSTSPRSLEQTETTEEVLEHINKF